MRALTEIWVCESAGSRLNKVAPLCALRFAWYRGFCQWSLGNRQAWTFSPETLGQSISALFWPSQSSLKSVICAHTLSMWEWMRTGSVCPWAPFNPVHSETAGSKFFSEPNLEWSRDECRHRSDEGFCLATALSWVWQPEAKRLTKTAITGCFCLTSSCHTGFCVCVFFRRLYISTWFISSRHFLPTVCLFNCNKHSDFPTLDDLWVCLEVSRGRLWASSCWGLRICDDQGNGLEEIGRNWTHIQRVSETLALWRPLTFHWSSHL